MASHLHWADYLVLVGFLIISLSIGIYHSLTGGRQKTVAEFIMGDRRLSVIPTAISLLVSFYSAITMLGLTAEMYSYGIQFLIFTHLGTAIGILLVERLIVPWIYPMKLVSIYDYLEKRYMSRSVGIFGSLLGIFVAVLYMGAAMYAPSAALESATGLPTSVSIPIMAVVSVTYTAIGGMRAVIWTDVFQFIAIAVGIVAILVRGLNLVGGIANVFELSGSEGRLVYANFSFDPRERQTVWTLVTGFVLGALANFGLSQSSVQRYSAVDKLWKARTTMLLNIPAIAISNLMTGFIGLIVLAYYSSIKCDPLANKDIANPNMLLPYFVATIFADYPGFVGLFLSALYGGALSSLSSLLSGAAANCWKDILEWKLGYLPESRKVLINRLLVGLFGVCAIGVAFFAASAPGPITQIAFAMLNSINGPLLAVFVIGAVSRHANWKGVLVGGIVGVSATLWLCIGSLTVRYTYPLPPVSMEHCSIGKGNVTFTTSSMNFTNYTSFEDFDEIDAGYGLNLTTELQPAARSRVTELRGLENFYAISYLLTLPFGIIVTGVVGIIASLLMRDRDLEAKVDERLLLRFRFCGWSGENENRRHCKNDEDRVSTLQRPEDDSLKTTEMMILKERENSSCKEKQDFFKREELKPGIGLLTKNGQGAASHL